MNAHVSLEKEVCFLKKFFQRLLVFIVIYLALTLLSSLLFPNLGEVMEKVVFGIVVVIGLALTDVIMKKWKGKSEDF